MKCSKQWPVKEIIEWDIPNWSVALDFWTKHTQLSLGRKPISALEIGARHGGISLWLALQGIEVRATDLEGPSELATRKHQKHGVSAHIKYEAMNALDIPYESAFDIVVFKSVLGAVGRNNVTVHSPPPDLAGAY